MLSCPGMDIRHIAKLLLSKGKGILAADESNASAGKRLEAVGVESTEETRRQYRDLFISAPNAENYLSGVILFDETVHQSADDGLSFINVMIDNKIIPGVKVDQGLQDAAGHPGEQITKGLEGLPARLAEYYKLGCRFAKWRAVVPVRECDDIIAANAKILAHYARECQAAGIVPIVEPEVLWEGDHDLETSADVTEKTITAVFAALVEAHVDLKAVILKTSMVLAGPECPKPSTHFEVGRATARVLRAAVPKEAAGVVFLSGGQEAVQATENLQAVVQNGPFPWPITFSYARALQGPALEVWQGKKENVKAAREVFLKRLKLNSAASLGKYKGE